MKPRTILFIHQSFPGQFGELAKSLAKDGHNVFGIGLNPQQNLPGVTILRYFPVREQAGEEMPEVLREMDAKTVRAESMYKAMKTLKEKGLEPDVIYAHPGWGEAMFVKNVWPRARYVVYAEWFYNNEGQEVNFDPALPALDDAQMLRLTFKNVPFLQALSECDAAVSPTQWQRSRFPKWAQDKIRVIHEGLKLDELAQVRTHPIKMRNKGIALRKGMPIVTFCARHLEPIRGFHYFMQAIPLIQARNPAAHFVIMGQDAGTGHTGYGRDNPSGTTWRQSLKEQLGSSVDWGHVHFAGLLERRLYLATLKLSACHVYMTTPFILSWSFLEAATLGLPIVASDTAPVREFGNMDGIDFVPFADPEALAQAVLKRLAQDTGAAFVRKSQQIAKLDISQTIPALKKVLLGEEEAVSNAEAQEEMILLDEE